jgi:small RNA 2'-O-methyltransferase
MIACRTVQPSSISDLHEERLHAVTSHLLQSGATTVLDLGCGDGHLLARLAATSQFSRLVGIDIDSRAIATARAALAAQGRDARTQVLCDSFENPGHTWAGFDAAVMLETIEHVDPGRLSRVEESVFQTMHPGTVLITTPNQEFNVRHGLAPGERRHWDHRFEWPRARFRHWARGVASRRGYIVNFVDIGPADPFLGSSTQMARFSKLPAANAAATPELYAAR